MSPHLILAILIAYLAVAFGWRSWLQYRRTGSTGFRGTSGRPGSAEWWGGVLLVLGFATSFLAPILAILGAAPSPLPLPPLAGYAGAALLFAGFAGTISAQLTMGTSWRIGVDPTEQTTLITHGLFRYVRNPIFTSMLTVSLALILLLPNLATTTGFALTWLGLQLHVRLVEEPYLTQTHPHYAAYAARVGRFLPKLY